jgi:hypothetical protein
MENGLAGISMKKAGSKIIGNPETTHIDTS